MQEGYIKLHRCILDSSWSKQPDFVAVWVYCLLRGNYKSSDVVTKGGGIVHLEPGQFITSREQISIGTGVQESKVERVLKVFKSEQQIEQRNCGYYRVISILNWSKYQQNEQEFEQCLNNERTINEQCLNTDKKVKKVNNKNKPITEFERERLDFFEQAWSIYPRKIGKPSALRFYLKTVKTDADINRINGALGNYLDSTKDTDSKFIKHGSTWFNNWQDWEVTNAE